MKIVTYIIITLGMLALLVGLVSCNSPATVQVTSASGQNVNITSSTRLGGRGGVAVKSGDVVVAVYDNNEDSFREGNKTVRLGFWLTALNSIANSVSDAVTTTNATEEATKLSTVEAQERRCDQRNTKDSTLHLGVKCSRAEHSDKATKP